MNKEVKLWRNLINNDDERKKAKGTKRCVIKRNLKTSKTVQDLSNYPENKLFRELRNQRRQSEIK